MEKRQLPMSESQRPDSANSNTDLFPDSLPRRPAPIVPTAGAVKYHALLALIAGPVSQPTFERSWRLAAYINELVNDGWAILSREIDYRGRVIAEYRLDMTNEPTRAAVAALTMRCRQGGLIHPQLAGLLVVAVPAVVAAVAMLAGWF